MADVNDPQLSLEVDRRIYADNINQIFNESFVSSSENNLTSSYDKIDKTELGVTCNLFKSLKPPDAQNESDSVDVFIGDNVANWKLPFPQSDGYGDVGAPKEVLTRIEEPALELADVSVVTLASVAFLFFSLGIGTLKTIKRMMMMGVNNFFK
ncbi:634_t:CDS:2 [Diversispora eburnea]|uniref:634_t:CDS:1 n=1 Tax=Diversispora eburnea TaxID=1213867 RepID=A0A9N9AGD2_9GLOM|nr:634_t:CDS:2 [Diversispora eburnea]